MKSLLRLKPYLSRYRRTLAVGILAILLSNLLYVVQPQLIGQAVDVLKAHLGSSRPTGRVLFHYALLVVGLTALSGYFSYLTRQTIIVVSRHIEFDLRNDFLAHLQRLPLSFFLRTPTGDIMAHATNDIGAVRNVVGPCIMYPLDTIVTFVLTISLMLWNDWRLTLLVLIPMPLISLLVFRLSQKIHAMYDARQAQFSLLTSRAQENLSGMRIVQAYVREDHEIRQFDSLSRDYLVKNMAVARVQSLIWPLMFMLVGCSMVIALYAGGRRVIDGRMTIGTLTAFFGYLVMLIWPMIAFGWVANMLQQGAASMARLNRIFDAESESSPAGRGEAGPDRVAGTVEFRGVTFQYPDTTVPALRGLTLTIPAGKTVAVVGYTGSGKSTLANLIPRLLEPTSGEIRLDGVDLRQIPLADLRATIGYVQQETFLFSETIAENIAYGVDAASEERVRQAAGIAQMDSDVAEFPEGFQTMVGERGITLSGGQKQRTSIARAILRDPRILILDDALSAVDTGTEARILQGLREVMRRRTTLLISHRVSAVKDADLIVVLDAGSIAEQGTHEELLAHRGIYADLYAKQLLEEELEAM